MKVFETIHLILLAAFLFGVPVAATARVSGQAFSWLQGLKQAGIATGCILVLLILNMLVARAISRARGRDGTKTDAGSQ